MVMTIFMNFMYVAIICVFFMMPGYYLTVGSYKLARPGEPQSLSSKIVGAIPMVNNVYLHKMFYNKFGYPMYAYSVVLAIFAFRLISIIIGSTILLLISAMADLVAIGIVWMVAAIVAIDIGRMVSSSFWKYIVAVVVPPLGCALIAADISPFLAHAEDEVKGTFLDEE